MAHVGVYGSMKRCALHAICNPLTRAREPKLLVLARTPLTEQLCVKTILGCVAVKLKAAAIAKRLKVALYLLQLGRVSCPLSSKALEPYYINRPNDDAQRRPR